MTEYQTALDRNFLNLAVQYYVAARSAVLAGLIPVSGTLYHHSIEMFLKARLSQNYSRKELEGFKHKLSKLWQFFKKEFPVVGFEQFDDTIGTLDLFERIRYPDNMIKEGAEMHIMWNKSPFHTGSISGPRSPRYVILVKDIDRLIARIFEVCSRNPLFFMGGMNEYARKAITHENPVSDEWFKAK